MERIENVDTNRIAELIEIVEGILANIEENQLTDTVKFQLAWKVLSSLSQVCGIVNSAKVRAPGQVLVGRLIQDEADRLIEKCTGLIGNPEELDMLKSMNTMETNEDGKDEKTDGES